MATGTDEHGLKIQQAARKAGLGEQEFTRQLSARFKVRFSSSFLRSSFSPSCCLVNWAGASLQRGPCRP